jgi:FkbM family methyltransferase
MKKLKKVILKITPKKILNLFSFKIIKQSYDLYKRIANISYSQQSEDLVLLKYFNNKWGGFYIDIGAYHPYIISNTYMFYKTGWRGINIEPNPDNYVLFTKKRKKDINLNIGISNEEKIQNYFKFNDPAMNTFIETIANSYTERKDTTLKSTIKIKTETLKNVLDKYLPSGQEIDFISIDAEGMSYDVIISNDWNKYRPKLILVEESICELEKFSDSKVFSFLKTVGYKLLYVNGGSLIFEDIK